MDVFKHFQAALSSTPYPVTQPPIRGGEETYLSFFEVLGRPDAHASNKPRRITHTMQVDIWSRTQIGPEFPAVARALRDADIIVASWGPADYEADTRWHHLPITCYWAENIEDLEG